MHRNKYLEPEPVHEDTVVPTEQEAAPKEIEPPQGDEEAPNADKKEDDTKSRASLASASSKREVMYLGNCILGNWVNKIRNTLEDFVCTYDITYPTIRT